MLLIGQFYLAFRDKGRLTWITTLTPTPETRDAAAPEPDPAPQPTSEMNHPDWVGVLVEEMGQMLKEYISPGGEKPSLCHKERESDGAAVEPTDVTTVQVPAELQRQSQPAAVTPVETRRSRMKVEHPDRGGTSQPTGETAVEIITESLTYKSQCVICTKTYHGDVRLIQSRYSGSGTLWVQACNWMLVRQGLWDP